MKYKNFDIYSLSSDQKIVNFFDYTGKIDFATADNLLVKLQEKLDESPLEYRVKKTVYAVSVEALYNTVDHGSHDFSQNSDIDFNVIDSPDRVDVLVANLVSNTELVGMVSRINLLNKLGIEQLRKEKITQIKNGKFSDKGGAGIGLIDIRMKTNQIILFNYYNIDSEYGRLFMHLVVMK